MTPDLKPTLWRTMRVLANHRRLQVLQQLLRRAPLSVDECAKLARLPRTTATTALRQLQARGLIRAERVSRWVRYRPVPDPLVQHAAGILGAMRDALAPKHVDFSPISKAVTAYTHERRIRIVQALHEEPLTQEQLSASCRISLPALSRHLDKLSRRNVICAKAHRWQLATPVSLLAAALLENMLADGHCR